MRPFELTIDLEEATSLYLIINEGNVSLSRLRSALRGYFYEHLSIEEMEKIEDLQRKHGFRINEGGLVSREQ